PTTHPAPGAGADAPLANAKEEAVLPPELLLRLENSPALHSFPTRRSPDLDLVKYTLTATNDGNVTLEGVEIKDPSLKALQCEPPQPAELPPNAEHFSTQNHKLSQAEIDEGALTNTATVTGTGPGGEEPEDE